MRRCCETVGDLDILVETDAPADVLAALAALPGIEPVATGTGLRGGQDRVSLQLSDGPHIDVMTMPPGAAGSYLVHFTGSAEHNVALRHRARQLGWSLSEHGLSPLRPGGPEPQTVGREEAPEAGAADLRHRGRAVRLPRPGRDPAGAARGTGRGGGGRRLGRCPRSCG